jgi:hypothetical protein
LASCHHLSPISGDAVVWPKSDCPPTEIAPLDVAASGEAAGRESEPPFTTEVAALLNVPVNIIYKWHKEGTRASGLSNAQGEPIPKKRCGPVAGEQGVTLAVCQSECGRTYTRTAFKAMTVALATARSNWL